MWILGSNPLVELNKIGSTSQDMASIALELDNSLPVPIEEDVEANNSNDDNSITNLNKEEEET